MLISRMGEVRRSFLTQHSTNIPAMMSTSGSIDLVLDLDNETQIVTLWDREARKEDLYKIAYSILRAEL